MTSLWLFFFLCSVALPARGGPRAPANSEDRRKPQGEPPWLHQLLDRLPENGAALRKFYLRESPRLAGEKRLHRKFMWALADIARYYFVSQECARRPSRELQEQRGILREAVGEDIFDLARSGPAGIKIFNDMTAPEMDSMFAALDIQVDAERSRAVRRAARLAAEASDKLRGGDPVEASREATEALELDPANTDALMARSGASYQMGRYDQAYQDAVNTLKSDPGNVSAYTMVKMTEGRLGPTQAGSGAPAAPDAANQPSESENPGTPPREAKVAPLSSGLAQSNEHAKAAARALEIKDYPEALRQADKAIEINPGNAQAYLYRAVANIKPGRYEDAVKDVEAGLKIVPSERVLLDTKAFVLNRLREFGSAKAAAQAASEADPGDAEAWHNLANAAAGLGDRTGMLSALRRAAALSPERFSGVYESAIQAPEARDLTYLFDGPNARPSGEPKASWGRVSPQNQFLLIALAALSGGFLVALGLLDLLAPSWAPWTGRLRRRRDVKSRPLIAGVYQVLREIGSGAMGQVYEAVDLALERPVAVKKMREEIHGDPRERERFLEEARLVAALRHPNIVEIHSILEDKGDLYLIFEFVQGTTLDRFLAKRGRLPFEEARRICRDICRALDYAHGRGIVHRDLKPSNVMVGEGASSVKVMDFGVARQAKDAITRRMVTGAPAGTPPYMAPEAEQGIVRKESDVYSLGVCLYEMLTGELPFNGVGSGMLLNKLKMNYQPPSRWIAGLPAGADELLAHALQPDPDKRLRGAAEFLRALDSIV